LEVLRIPRVRRLCMINLAFTLAVTQMEAIFAYFMIDTYQFDASSVAFIFVGMAVLMAGIQSGAIRPLAERFGERKLILFGFALLACSLLTVPFMPTVGLTLLPLALSAVGRGVGQPPILSLVSMTATPASRGSVMGTFQSSASLGRVFGPAVAGVLYGFSHTSPFVLASALMVTAWLMAVRLPEDRSD
jgi:MFS family permease